MRNILSGFKIQKWVGEGEKAYNEIRPLHPDPICQGPNSQFLNSI